VVALTDLLWRPGRLASLGLGDTLADTVAIRAVSYLGGALLVAAAVPGLATTPPKGPRDVPSTHVAAARPRWQPRGGTT
jgi:hypothetical protein